MIKKKLTKFLPKDLYVYIIVAVWVLFSSPFLFFGKNPYPADYQNNSFAPISSYPGYSGPVKNNAQPDIIDQIYPWRHFTITELKKGSIPFWNPYSFSGTPHMANYQSAVLFPLNLLFFLPFSFADIWGLLVILQPLLAGIFTYLLARRFGISNRGSTLSAVSFMFCGFITTWLGYATLGYAILPLPLALFFIDQYIKEEKQYSLVMLSVTIMFSYFSGHFQTSIYLTLSLILFLVHQFITSTKRSRVIECFLFTLFGLLLAMPQVLLSIEFYAQSVRSVLFQKVEAIPLSYLPTLIAPDYYGNPVTRNDWFGHYAEWSGYMGVVPFSFALFAILFKRSRKTIFFILLAVISILLSYDTPFLTLIIFLKIPVLSTSAASRAIVLLSFSLAILSGFGFDAFIETIKIRKKSVFLFIGLLLLIIAGIYVFSYSPYLTSEQQIIAQKNSIIPSIIVLAIILLSMLAIFLPKKKYISLILLCFVLIASLEMFRFASKWQSFSPKKLIYPPVGITDFYNKFKIYDRAIGLSGGEDGVYFQVPILSGYDPLYIARYGEFVNYIANGKISEPSRSVVNFPLDGKYTAKALEILGVKYVVHKVSDGSFPWAFPFGKYPLDQFTKIYDDTHYQVFLNRHAYRKVFLVPQAVVLNKKDEIMSYLTTQDMRNSAVVEEKVEGIDPHAKGKVRIIKYQPNKITVEATTNGSMLLVMTDNFYPGWKAKVNGNTEKIYRANYTFRGVVVPNGKSEITFSYLPDSFLAGVYLFMIGIMGIIASTIFKKFQIKS